MFISGMSKDQPSFFKRCRGYAGEALIDTVILILVFFLVGFVLSQ